MLLPDDLEKMQGRINARLNEHVDRLSVVEFIDECLANPDWFKGWLAEQALEVGKATRGFWQESERGFPPSQEQEKMYIGPLVGVLQETVGDETQNKCLKAAFNWAVAIYGPDPLVSRKSTLAFIFVYMNLLSIHWARS